METKQLDRQYAFCNKIIDLKNDIEKNFLALGKGLMKIRDERLYNPAWDSFAEYLGELRWTEGTASKYINIYKTLVLEYGNSEQAVIDAGGWTVANRIEKVVKKLPNGKKESVRLLDLASILSPSDFEKEMNALVNGIDEIDCPHKNTYTIEICRDCGMRKQIIEEKDV